MNIICKSLFFSNHFPSIFFNKNINHVVDLLSLNPKQCLVFLMCLTLHSYHSIEKLHCMTHKFIPQQFHFLAWLSPQLEVSTSIADLQVQVTGVPHHISKVYIKSHSAISIFDSTFSFGPRTLILAHLRRFLSLVSFSFSNQPPQSAVIFFLTFLFHSYSGSTNTWFNSYSLSCCTPKYQQHLSMYDVPISRLRSKQEPLLHHRISPLDIYADAHSTLSLRLSSEACPFQTLLPPFDFIYFFVMPLCN